MTETTVKRLQIALFTASAALGIYKLAKGYK